MIVAMPVQVDRQHHHDHDTEPYPSPHRDIEFDEVVPSVSRCEHAVLPNLEGSLLLPRRPTRRGPVGGLSPHRVLRTRFALTSGRTSGRVLVLRLDHPEDGQSN